ncbi:MAG: dTDP-4-dehydrorhamnose reductase [bacterium]
MRIVVTGAAGMLGRAFCGVLNESHTVVGVDMQDLDLSLDSCIPAIVRMRPQVVCHLAAFTDVDRCESDPETAYHSNVVASRNVAVACKEAGCPMLYMSTDFVFDGKAERPYSERDKPNPLNMYGKTKLIGEWFVERHAEDHWIVRTSWLFGKGGRNFVDTILALARQKDSIDVVDDQRGSPTYTKDLAPALKNIIESGKFGTYHVTNSGDCTWYDFAVMICKQAGIEGFSINRTRSDLVGRPAERPAYSVLDNGAYARAFGACLRNWKEALQDYLHTRNGGESNG